MRRLAGEYFDIITENKIDGEYLNRYGDKEKIQVHAAQQRMNVADVNSTNARSAPDTYYLDSEKNIQQESGNVKGIDAEPESNFDREIIAYRNGELPESHIFNLGKPGRILRQCGFPAGNSIEMSASRLEYKANLKRHQFDLNDILGLDRALEKPVAVFSYGERTKSQNIIVNIEKDGKNFLAGVHFNQKNRGYEISDIRTLYPKDNIEWLNWINQGKMIYGDKEKLQALITQQRMNVAEVNNQIAQSPLYKHCLESADTILRKFGNVNEIFTDGYPAYSEYRERFSIENRFFTYYTSLGNLDAREIASAEAAEFYSALKTGNEELIREYIEDDLRHESVSVAKEIYQEWNESRSRIEPAEPEMRGATKLIYI